MKKMPVEFSPTDSFFNVVPVIVKTDVKGCLASVTNRCTSTNHTIYYVTVNSTYQM